MPKLDDVKNTNVAFSIMEIGYTGTGKTIASCGKEWRPVKVFDLDQRMLSVANYYKKLDGHCKDVDFTTFSMGDSFKVLDKEMDDILARPSYKTVVIASLTAYIHIVLAHVLKYKSGKNEGKKIADINVNSIEDYNVEDAAIIFELIGFLKTLQAQGVNVILEAHLTKYQLNKLDGSSETKVEILTKGRKAPAAIPGYFDEVWQFKAESKGIVEGMGRKDYKMLTVGDFGLDTKTSRGLPGEIAWTNKDFSVELFNHLKVMELRGQK